MGERASILDDESILYGQYYSAMEHMNRDQRVRYVNTLPSTVQRIAWKAYAYLKEIEA